MCRWALSSAPRFWPRSVRPRSWGGGFAAAAPLGHRLFGGHGFGVWALEVGNDVINCVLMGGILTYAQS
ncbi:MAG: hypothetical protein EBS89_07635 [Proteobacteria bacterium]|nr:hypothetical protein [Pseudomonadota bacterium]